MFLVGRVAFHSVRPHPVVVPHVQDFAFTVVELQEVPVRPFLQPVNGGTTIWCISHSPQFCNICKLPEDVLCPSMQVINEDVKQYWVQYQPLGLVAGLHLDFVPLITNL